MTLLKVVDLSVRCGSVPIVHRGCLSIPRGTAVGLFGPSGSGKSTTLLAICGLLQSHLKATGSIEFKGVDIAALRPEQRSNLGISIVLQGLALFPDLSVLENVMYPLRRRGVRVEEAKRRALERLEEFRLCGFEHRQPHSLSGGQQQRVALARAMVFDPDLLLLDEPFKGLEQELRDDLLAQVRGIARSGRSILLVTHERREVYLAADIVIPIREGTIGEPESRARPGDGEPFAATMTRALIPSPGGSVGRSVGVDQIALLIDLSSGTDKTGDTQGATVLEVRSLGGLGRTLLVEYSTGTLGWIEVPASESIYRAGDRLTIRCNDHESEA